MSSSTKTKTALRANLTPNTKTHSHSQKLNIFSYIEEPLLSNKEELIVTINKIIKEIDTNMIDAEHLFEIVTFIKSCIKKNKNIHVDPIFSLTYPLIFLQKLTNKRIPVLSGLIAKILFDYANLYSELNENAKSCFAIIKHFEFEKEFYRGSEHGNSENCHFGLGEDLNSWLVREFNSLYLVISNLKSNKSELKKYLLHTLEKINLIQTLESDLKMKFFILLLNNIAYTTAESFVEELIEIVYEFLNKNKILIINKIPQIHFNNLLKIVSKMNDCLVKINKFKLSNKLKIFLFDFLFSSKFSNLKNNLTYTLVHINELLILQKSKNWKNELEKNQSFLEANYIDLFIESVFSNLEKEINSHILSLSNSNLLGSDSKPHDLKLQYMTILGKFYNFYYMFPSLTNKASFYSDKIISYYNTHKIITNEILMIKVNIFKDFINENKNNLLDLNIITKLTSDLNEITILIKNIKFIPNPANEFFITIVKFLLKCFDNLVIQINYLYNLNNFVNESENSDEIPLLFSGIDNFFEILTAYHKSQLEKHQEVLNINFYHTFIKLVIEILLGDDSSNNSFYHLVNSRLRLVYQWRCEDLKNKITQLINFTTIGVLGSTIQIQKARIIINYLSNADYDIYYHSIVHYLTSLSKSNCKVFNKLSLNKVADTHTYGMFSIIDELCEIFEVFRKATEGKVNIDNDNSILFSKIESILIFIFSSCSEKIKKNFNIDKDYDNFKNHTNTLLNYYQIASTIIDNLTVLLNYRECNTQLILLLDFFENIFQIDDTNFIAQFIYKSIIKEDTKYFHTLIKRLDYLDVIKSIGLEFCLGKTENGLVKDEKLSDLRENKIKFIFYLLNMQTQNVNDNSEIKMKFELSEVAKNILQHMTLFNEIDFKQNDDYIFNNCMKDTRFFEIYSKMIISNTEESLSNFSESEYMKVKSAYERLQNINEKENKYDTDFSIVR